MSTVANADDYVSYVDQLAKQVIRTSNSETMHFPSMGTVAANFELVPAESDDEEEEEEETIPIAVKVTPAAPSVESVPQQAEEVADTTMDVEDEGGKVMVFDDDEIPPEYIGTEGPFGVTPEEADAAPDMIRAEYQTFCENFMEKYNIQPPEFSTFVLFRRMLIIIYSDNEIPPSFYDGDTELAGGPLFEIMERGSRSAKEYLEKMPVCPLRDALASLVERVEHAKTAIGDYVYDVEIKVSMNPAPPKTIKEDVFKNADIVTALRMKYDRPVYVVQFAVSGVKSLYMWVSNEEYDPFVIFMFQKFQQWLNPTDTMTKARVEYRKMHIDQLHEQHVHDLLVSQEGTQYILKNFETVCLIEYR